MADEATDKGVNMDGEDRVTHDHDAGVGSPADEIETHNLDFEDYDRVVKSLEDFDEDEEEATGESETTDESESEEVVEQKDDDEARIPKSRLDEVINERNELRSNLMRMEGRLQSMEQMLSSKQEQQQEQAPAALPLDDLFANQDPQEILDSMQENPAEFFKSLSSRMEQQAEQRVAERQAAAAYDKALYDSLDKFASEHEDFMGSIESLAGKLPENPAHNVISLYAYEVEIPKIQADYEAKIKELEGGLEAAKQEGYKEGRKKTIEEIRAKYNASTLDGSQSTRGAATADDPDLQEVDRNDLRSVLTERLKRKRAAS